ncbi:hypothetical protein C8Q75DRAFT_747617 [Abortiporus biennis]|nr:hypothetical protein C8Q75DRAFT_747617 [Abortiporus biennis]
MSDDSAVLVEYFWMAFFGTASYVSMAALAIYDYFITFDQEVQHIWKTKFNLSSTIFVVNRYFNLFAVVGFAAVQLFPRTRLSCLGLSFSIWVSITVSEIAFSFFFVVRTWAIWGQQFLPLLVLTPLALSVIAFNAALNFATTYGGIYPLQTPYGGCIMLPTLSDNVSNRLQVAASALSIALSFLVLCGTLSKTLALKRAARQAGIKSSLVSLLIRDGTAYLCLTLALNLLQTIIFNIQSTIASIEVIIGPIIWFRGIILSRMILDLRTIDQVSMASLPEIHTSRFGSVQFIGNVGAPLNMSFMNDLEDEDEADTETTHFGAFGDGIPAKQIIEDPLSIGLLDANYNSSMESPNSITKGEGGMDA